MRKYTLILLLAVLCSTSINAQIGSERGFRLKVPCSYAYSTPLVRSVNATTIVAYYEHNYHGVFVVMKQSDLTPDTIELPHHHYVYDFEIIGQTVYFCGEMIDITDLYDTKEHALAGKFDITPLLNGGSSTMIHYNNFDVANRDHNKLKKMVAYTDNQNKSRIMAVGESFSCIPPEQPHSGIEFFAIIDATSSSFTVDVNVFTTETYHDIIETDNHVVLVGGNFNVSDAICFRKIRKYNIQSSERDILYWVDLPNVEPLSVIYGEHLSGDRFITATYGHIDGIEGTVLRTFNASEMEMIHAQFIPFPGEKTQPLELRYVPATDKILLLQLSTITSPPRIYTIDPYLTQNYSTISEYCSNYTLHSLDMYRSDEYIAMGISGPNPAFYARNVLFNNPNCVIRNTVNVEMIDVFPLSGLNDSLQMDPITHGNYSHGVNSSSCNLSLECY